MGSNTSADTEVVRVQALRVGRRVRVKDRDDILATLDARGRVDGLPFMPEMLAFAGQTFEVDAVTHRTCDTVKTGGTSGTTRRMERAVHLRGARCDGSAHGGCQARCLLYWKLDWLQPVGAEPQQDVHIDVGHQAESVPPLLAGATRGGGHSVHAPVYSCQATELLRATTFVSARNPWMWIRDVRSRNARLSTAVKSMAALALNKVQQSTARLPLWTRIRNDSGSRYYRPPGERPTFPPLDLHVGELVEVKSLPEIKATLDKRGALRGLRFSAEMVPYCGKQARVLARVDRIIDEKTGRMLKLRDCIILEDVWCQGTFRALCRRKIYTYWREAWLRRVDSAESARYDSSANARSA